MDKYRRPHSDEEPSALDGPDYVAVVIEWEERDEAAQGGTAAAPGSDMIISDNDPVWSRVDEASLESFPASDPPAWGSSHAVAVAMSLEAAAAPEAVSEEVTTPFRSGARISRVRLIVLGIAAIMALLSMIEGLRRIRRHA